MQFIGILQFALDTIKTFYHQRLRFTIGDTGTHRRIFSLSKSGLFVYFMWETTIFLLVQNSYFIQFIFAGQLEFISPTGVSFFSALKLDALHFFCWDIKGEQEIWSSVF